MIKENLMRFLTLLICAVCISSPAALACSYEAGAEPICPSGQVFDGADLCKCVDAPADSPRTTLSDYDIVMKTPAEFTTCTQNSDCTLVRGACGNTVAVNTHHAEKYEAAMRKVAMIINCSSEAEFSPSRFSANCQDNTCHPAFIKTLEP
jgi:hypothetical protein